MLQIYGKQNIWRGKLQLIEKNIHKKTGEIYVDNYVEMVDLFDVIDKKWQWILFFGMLKNAGQVAKIYVERI